MQVTFKIRRLDPARPRQPYWQEFPVEAAAGMVVLDALHEIHDRQDGTLGYRYSCRGAICGSCGVRINGVARLTCKTQVRTVADDGGTVTLEPMLNLPVIKDLVVDQEPFFEAMRRTSPYAIQKEDRALDASVDYAAGMSDAELDEWNRSSYCIKCQACFSDCPKRLEDATFIGPAACVDIFKHVYDVRDDAAEERMQAAASPGGVFACDRHANCVKVCPKDIRPMRAIVMLVNRAKKAGLAPPTEDET